MKAISYSLFGYERERHQDCFDFNSYLRHFMMNLRLNRLIYPDWTIILNTDEATYYGYQHLFDSLKKNGTIRLDVNPNGAPLCRAMLWRLKPVFEMKDGYPIYSHVLCRDLDSPPTYRERQAVEVWIKHDKAIHAITDSISHNIPLLGGMIGIRPDYFTMRMGCNTWDSMLNTRPMDLSQKGSDQTWLNVHVYPVFAKPGSDSITQHYVLGHGNTFLSDYHNHIEDIPCGIPEQLKESNTICGHIGAAGWYEAPLFKFLRPYWDRFGDLSEIEKHYKEIFYWNADIR